MKLDDFPVVETLIDARATLVRMRDEGRIIVTIEGRNQDAAFVDGLRPAIHILLNSRIDEIDQQLHDLGVQVG